MTQDVWAVLAGAGIGAVGAIVSSWLTSLAKARSEENARWQERQFRLEDQQREAQKALEAAIAAEDKYWFEKSLQFNVIQSGIFRARGADEILKSHEDLQRFLEETPEYLFEDNLNLLYLYCHSDFRQRVPAMDSENAELQRFVKKLLDFKVPTGADIRKRRNEATAT
jgi:hypothetical protein